MNCPNCGAVSHDTKLALDGCRAIVSLAYTESGMRVLTGWKDRLEEHSRLHKKFEEMEKFYRIESQLMKGRLCRSTEDRTGNVSQRE